MKIGIVTSGVDMLVLFRFLAKHEFCYEIFYDQEGGLWGDKTSEFVLSRAKEGIAYLEKKGVTKIIVPPVVEVALLHDKKYAELILPLRTVYAKECLSASPVGKIGFAGDYVDVQMKEQFEAVFQSYVPNERQTAITTKKKGGWKLSFRRKEMRMWKYYLTELGFKSQLVHHSLKSDFRYFKEAMVDTLIPTQYGLFAYEVMLGKFFNTKKQRFHRLEKIEKEFSVLTQNLKLKTQNYEVIIYYTGTLDHLLREKKWVRILQRGKQAPLAVHKIERS